MENSKIEWCHHTVNIWWGCFEVHAGCDNCYAKTQANRFHGPDILWQRDGPRMYIKSAFKDLEKYQKNAAAANIIQRVFINSMSDIFEKSMPVVDFNHELMLNDNDDYMQTYDLRKRLFEEIDKCPNLTFILLTKRPSNIKKMVPADWLVNPRKNVIFMTSVVDQITANTLIPQLFDVPGNHGLSMEPLIGNLNIFESIKDRSQRKYSEFNKDYLQKNLQWVIVGGESGNGARPMAISWARYIKWQCREADIPFFFKQDSEASKKDYKKFESFPFDLQTRQFPILNEAV